MNSAVLLKQLIDLDIWHKLYKSFGFLEFLGIQKKSVLHTME